MNGELFKKSGISAFIYSCFYVVSNLKSTIWEYSTCINFFKTPCCISNLYADCNCICIFHFVMLNQFILSLAKDCYKSLCLFSTFTSCLLFHLLPWCKRWSQKIKASPNRSARLAAHARQQSLQHLSFTYFIQGSMFRFRIQLFQKVMPFLLV